MANVNRGRRSHHTLRDEEVSVMLMRTDPFQQIDRMFQQIAGTTARPAAMPMDAWREGQDFVHRSSWYRRYPL
jgi:predicted naringenin-chalcone synthase